MRSHPNSNAPKILRGAILAAVSFSPFLSHGLPAAAAQETAEPSAPPSPAASPTASLDEQIQGVFKKVESAIVRIEASNEIEKLSGTGFFLDPTGTICTHYTIAGEAETITVVMGDQRLDATRLIADPHTGLAILKVNATTPFLSTANPEEVKVASPVLVVGFTRDLPLTPALGCVASFDKSYLDRFLPTMHIRASVPVEPGQAGAPLVNLKGEVVGMVSFRIDTGTSCYALPIQAAQKLHHDYMRYGRISRGWVGVNVEFRFLGDEGPLITGLAPKSPANAVGIQPNDILVQIGDTRIKSPGDLIDATFYLTAGEVAPFTVLRDGKRLTFQVEPLAPEPVIAPGPSASSSSSPEAVRLTPQ